MNTSSLLQSKWRLKGFALTLQETWSIHDSMNRPKVGGFLVIRRTISLNETFTIFCWNNVWRRITYSPKTYRQVVIAFYPYKGFLMFLFVFCFAYPALFRRNNHFDHALCALLLVIQHTWEIYQQLFYHAWKHWFNLSEPLMPNIMIKLCVFQGGTSFVDHSCYSCLVFVLFSCASVYWCLVVTCWEKTDPLALVCDV